MGKVIYLKPGETKCPVCGSTHICEISRVSGYLAVDERFCESKVKERNDRVDHNNEHLANYNLEKKVG